MDYLLKVGEVVYDAAGKGATYHPGSLSLQELQPTVALCALIPGRLGSKTSTQSRFIWRDHVFKGTGFRGPLGISLVGLYG